MSNELNLLSAEDLTNWFKIVGIKNRGLFTANAIETIAALSSVIERFAGLSEVAREWPPGTREDTLIQTLGSVGSGDDMPSMDEVDRLKEAGWL